VLGAYTIDIDCLGGVVLGLPGGMGVGSEGKPCVIVAQHGGHCFYIYPILQGHGRKGMPIGYNKGKTESLSVFKGLRVCPYSFSIKSRVKIASEKRCRRNRGNISDKNSSGKIGGQV